MQWGLRVISGLVLIKSGPEITEPENARENRIQAHFGGVMKSG
jgi:hypothetical protein